VLPSPLCAMIIAVGSLSYRIDQEHIFEFIESI
jgi:hypothetical protein